MAINFPNNPSSGEIYTEGNKSWQWLGNRWGAYNIQNPEAFAFRNKIINGSFQIAQRTTGSSPTPSAGVTVYPSLDRWFIAQTGTTAQLFLGQTTPQTTGVFKAGYFGRTSGQTNAPNYIFMGQQIESFNVYDLRGKTATVSFNVFRGANAPTNLSICARFGTTADQPSSNGLNGSWTGWSEATPSLLSVNTTATSYTYNFSVPSNASELMVLVYYVPTGTAGANEWFAFENFQLESGSTATPFEQRPIGTELALCQRYYQVLPQLYINNVSHAITVYYKTSMRTPPQIIWGSTFASGSPGNINTESFTAISTTNAVAACTLNAEL